jgi:putative cardiolipin synthase
VPPSASSNCPVLNRNSRWRLALLDSARRSIDIQYYLFYGDAAGLLILERLLAAADRGVRVRLLVDDINMMLRNASTIRLRDQGAALLDSHPNIELRVFNPWSRRGLASRAGEMLTDMRRLNQRMHHKMLVVDNRAVILGGRGSCPLGTRGKTARHEVAGALPGRAAGLDTGIRGPERSSLSRNQRDPD